MHHFAYSYNDDKYHGEFDCADSALLEAVENKPDLRRVWISSFRSPVEPALAVGLGSLFMGQLAENQDYNHELGECWTQKISKAQMDDLDQRLRGAVDAWIHAHNLQPNFMVAYETEELDLDQIVARLEQIKSRNKFQLHWEKKPAGKNFKEVWVGRTPGSDIRYGAFQKADGGFAFSFNPQPGKAKTENYVATSIVDAKQAAQHHFHHLIFR